MHDETVSDETLGAYVDGELDADSAARLTSRLDRDPALKSRVDALRQLSGWVRAAARPDLADGPLRPPRARPRAAQPSARAPSARRLPRRALYPALAASFVAGLLASFFGLRLVHGDDGGWPEHALLFHERYLAALDEDRALPLDARADDPAALGESLASFAGDGLAVVPDLSDHGYSPRGARLIETNEGPVAYLLYGGEDRPLLGVAVLRSDGADASSRKLHEHGGLRLIEWSDGAHRFAVGGEHSAASLSRLADAVEAFAQSASPDEI